MCLFVSADRNGSTYRRVARLPDMLVKVVIDLMVSRGR